MIQATARILQNLIDLKVGEEHWTCRPVVTATGPISRRIASLFSTNYETYRPTDPTRVYSHVSYAPKKDEILIQIGEEKWHTRSSLFGPILFEHGNQLFEVHEKLTGRFGITRQGELVARGEFGFRTCTIHDSRPELEGFLAHFALGYLIRSLWWALFR